MWVGWVVLVLRMHWVVWVVDARACTVPPPSPPLPCWARCHSPRVSALACVRAQVCACPARSPCMGA